MICLISSNLDSLLERLMQIPSKFVYDPRKKIWKPRKHKGSIGRIAYVHPASGSQPVESRSLAELITYFVSYGGLTPIFSLRYNNVILACTNYKVCPNLFFNQHYKIHFLLKILNIL
ncbi:uncharacterized protein [Pyrus communis]|uniref:uncharacterized protein n=1 Tax=Pyrus communis TaxID=23211 RepID=UPI0035C1060C